MTTPATLDPDGSDTPVDDPALDAETPTPTPEVEDTEPDGEGDDSGTTRAARRQHRDGEKYRQQLRDEQAARAAEQAAWESERTSLRSTVERYQRSEVERAVANRLADPADIWAGGIQLADVLADDGTLDTDALDAAVTDLLVRHPHWRTPFNAAAPASAVSFGATRPDVEAGDPFVLAFTPKDQR